MDISWYKIIVSSIIIATGWFISHSLTFIRTIELNKRQKKLENIEKQIKELYGPIYLTRKKSRSAHQYYYKRMPKDDYTNKVIDLDKMNDDDHLIHDVVSNNYLTKFNNEILDIITNNSHLIVYDKNGEIPVVFQKFIDHVFPFQCSNEVWNLKKINKARIKSGTFPEIFDQAIKETLDDLNEQYKKELKPKSIVSYFFRAFNFKIKSK